MLCGGDTGTGDRRQHQTYQARPVRNFPTSPLLSSPLRPGMHPAPCARRQWPPIKSGGSRRRNFRRSLRDAETQPWTNQQLAIFGLELGDPLIPICDRKRCSDSGWLALSMDSLFIRAHHLDFTGPHFNAKITGVRFRYEARQPVTLRCYRTLKEAIASSAEWPALPAAGVDLRQCRSGMCPRGADASNGAMNSGAPGFETLRRVPGGLPSRSVRELTQRPRTCAHEVCSYSSPYSTLCDGTFPLTWRAPSEGSSRGSYSYCKIFHQSLWHLGPGGVPGCRSWTTAFVILCGGSLKRRDQAGLSASTAK